MFYEALLFACPGCAELLQSDGLHRLPVNTAEKAPSWTFDGDTDAPTLSPSILSSMGEGRVCHSFLRNGVFEFLSDSTHSMAGQSIPMPDLPEWAANLG